MLVLEKFDLVWFRPDFAKLETKLFSFWAKYLKLNWKPIQMVWNGLVQFKLIWNGLGLGLSSQTRNQTIWFCIEISKPKLKLPV